MSSPTSTPVGSKRSRDDIPVTRKLYRNRLSESYLQSYVDCWLGYVFFLSVASSDGLASPPSQRRRGQDSSNGDLPAMPTSPATDIASPAVHDTSLFSSPRRSGNCFTIIDTQNAARCYLRALFAVTKKCYFCCIAISGTETLLQALTSGPLSAKRLRIGVLI